MKVESLSEKFVRDYWNKQAIKDVKEAVKELIKIGLKNGAIYYNDIENVFGGALV